MISTKSLSISLKLFLYCINKNKNSSNFLYYYKVNFTDYVFNGFSILIFFWVYASFIKSLINLVISKIIFLILGIKSSISSLSDL